MMNKTINDIMEQYKAGKITPEEYSVLGEMLAAEAAE